MVLFIKGIFLFLTLFSSVAQATEFYEPIQTTRQLGMGGVYVFDENDGGAFTQNPAYTCFSKGLNWAVANANVSIGDLTNYDWINEHLVQNQERPTLDTLSDFMGKGIYLQAAGFSSLSMPCFGASISQNRTGKFMVQNPAYPHIDTFYQTDNVFSVGGGMSLGDYLSLGMDVKRMQRNGGPYIFGPDSISTLTGSDGFQTLLDSVDNGGTAYGLDAGVAARLPMPFNPTASLSWKDVGSTAFTKTSGLDAPTRQKDNLVMGFTFDQSLLLLGVAGGIEYRHVTDTGEPIGKKIHMGMELSVANMDIRAGFYQGYTTYGASIDFWLLRLEGALYSVETGAYPGQTPDKRAQIGLSVDLSFDPNFKLVDSGGKKRRLKQRR